MTAFFSLKSSIRYHSPSHLFHYFSLSAYPQPSCNGKSFRWLFRPSSPGLIYLGYADTFIRFYRFIRVNPGNPDRFIRLFGFIRVNPGNPDRLIRFLRIHFAPPPDFSPRIIAFFISENSNILIISGIQPFSTM